MEIDETRWEAAAARHEEAVALLSDGDAEGARFAAEEALAALEAVVGPAHPDVGNALDTLAAALARLGRPLDALATWRDIRARWRVQKPIAASCSEAYSRNARSAGA